MAVERVAVVDPYSSGSLVAPAFAEHGYECVAVQTSREAPDLFRSSFRPDDFVSIIHANGEASTADELTRLDVRHVLAGSEPGVELADELCERLGLPANGVATRAARRDKYLMGEAVRARGLRTPAQFHSPRLDELRSWAESDARWPVVAKPLRSVASDSVVVCETDAELERAHDAIAGRTNVLGLVNESVLVQELVDGPEYVVDTVSHAGHHRVAAFWRYHAAPSDAPLGVFYDAMELLPYEGERQEALLAHAVGVLDALEIRYGPAHTELIWADGHGPVLIETGARLSAGNNAVLSRLCGGPCALDLVVEQCLDPDGFLAMPPPGLTGTAMNCFLVPPRGRRLRSNPPLDGIRELTSFHGMSIAETSRRHPVAGVVTLIHRDRSVVHEDLGRLRDLERAMLYEPS
jgi:biotin carboxylase